MIRNAMDNFKAWAFQWKLDEDGDIVFVIFHVFAFTKYKDSTLIQFNPGSLEPAPKYMPKVIQEGFRATKQTT